jgi:predicted permease
MAWLTLLVFRGLSVNQVPLESFSLDGRVLAFTATVAISSTLLFGALPALLAPRFDLDAALRGGGGRTTRRNSVLGVGLSAGQMALTLALLVGAALLTQTLRNLYSANLGLSLDGVSELFIDAPSDLPPDAFGELGDEVARSVAAVPGVESVTVSAANRPHIGYTMTLGRIWRAEETEAESRNHLGFGVAPGWFEFFGIEALRGRTFREPDRAASSPRPIVLNAALSRTLYGSVDAVGRRVMAGGRAPEEFEVVGVVSDIRGAEAPTEPRPAFFVTLQSSRPFASQIALYARATDADPGLPERIQDAVATVVPELPMGSDPVPVSDHVDEVRHEQIALRRLLTLLSIVTVLLSAVGLYGVVAHAVTNRRREFAIRSAAGAPGRQLARIVARYAATIVVLGAASGLVGAFTLSQVIESRLFGVEALDPASYLLAVAVLGLAAALACLRPTLLASRVDPATVLRHD